MFKALILFLPAVLSVSVEANDRAIPWKIIILLEEDDNSKLEGEITPSLFGTELVGILKDANFSCELISGGSLLVDDRERLRSFSSKHSGDLVVHTRIGSFVDKYQSGWWSAKASGEAIVFDSNGNEVGSYSKSFTRQIAESREAALNAVERRLASSLAFSMLQGKGDSRPVIELIQSADQMISLYIRGISYETSHLISTRILDGFEYFAVEDFRQVKSEHLFEWKLGKTGNAPPSSIIEVDIREKVLALVREPQSNITTEAKTELSFFAACPSEVGSNWIRFNATP